MPNDTATLVLSGPGLPLGDYGHALDEFDGLMTALADDFGMGATLTWLLEDLRFGQSADGLRRILTTARGDWQTDETLRAVEAVVRAYEEVGETLQAGESLTKFSARVARHATSLVGLINGHIKSVRFETREAEAEIIGPPDAQRAQAPKLKLVNVAQSSVRGRVESISRRGGLRFTLYDYYDDLPISCYLDKGMEEMVRDIWGKVVVVEGLVRRDPQTGKVTTIRQIRGIRSLPESNTWNFRAARGAIKWHPGDMLPEDAIRLVRDG